MLQFHTVPAGSSKKTVQISLCDKENVYHKSHFELCMKQKEMKQVCKVHKVFSNVTTANLHMKNDAGLSGKLSTQM